MLPAVSILLAVLIGFLLIRTFDPVRDMQPRWAAVSFDAALGAGIGIGLTSIIFLLLEVSGAATPGAIFGIDILLVAVLAGQRFRTRSGDSLRSVPPHSRPGDVTPSFRWTWALALAFGIVLAIAWVRLIQVATALPVGNWDAWAIWNLRAKFLAGPGGAWRYALSPLLNNSHPDYPVLLPAFIARVWKASSAVSPMGITDTIAPVLTSL